MRKALTGIAIAIAAAAAVRGQDGLTGLWRGETKSGVPVALELKVAGTTVTGTLTTEGHDYAIADGKVSDKGFTFTATVMDRPEKFSAELSGGRITMRMEARPANPAVLNRVAPGEVTGKWEGATPNGTPLALDLTVTGTAMTGTLSRSGERVTIADGKVSKNGFTFKATFGDQTETLTGVIDGDQMTVWLDRQGRDRAAMLKRVKG